MFAVSNITGLFKAAPLTIIAFLALAFWAQMGKIDRLESRAAADRVAMRVAENSNKGLKNLAQNRQKALDAAYLELRSFEQLVSELQSTNITIQQELASANTALSELSRHDPIIRNWANEPVPNDVVRLLQQPGAPGSDRVRNANAIRPGTAAGESHPPLSRRGLRRAHQQRFG